MVQQRNNQYLASPARISKYNNNNNSNSNKNGSCSRPVSPSLFIPIRLEWDNGKVVTETTTEFREVTDDSDFGNFGTSTGAPKLETRPEVKKIGPAAKTESSSSSSEDESEDQFAEEALKAHNMYRARHNVGPLKLDKKLCKFAKEWADQLAKQDRFEHRPDQVYGENIYSSWSSDPKAKCSGSRPVESWYSEVNKYNFDNPSGNSMGAGHFTQVVWKDSKNFGIAKARSKSGKIIVVANYDPAGNFLGQYGANVFKAK